MTFLHSHMLSNEENNWGGEKTNMSSVYNIMEEPGEQCTVVFALIDTQPASECVGGVVVGGGAGGSQS